MADGTLEPLHGLGARPELRAVGAFVASMPDAYRETWLDDVEAIAAHAAIADADADADDREGRDDALGARLRIWRELEPDVACVCFVATDRPGLLARVTAAIVAHEIDVVRAEAYCRTRPDGTLQAVDLLWLRRFQAGTRVRAADVARIERMVDALARGHARLELEGGRVREKRRAGGETVVRFERHRKTGALALAVEARDRPGLLLAVTSALFRAGCQITSVRATSEGGVAKDRFELVELEGSQVDAGRQLELQIAILAALEDGG